MKKTRQLLFTVTAWLLSFGSYAQNNPTDANAKSDASLQGSGKMGNIYNVNLYDGTASANIPIFDYSIEGLDLGVSLSYDTRGIKVDQAASAVGLGWALMAGGYIERTIKGVPDENHPEPLFHHTNSSIPHTNPCSYDAPLESNYHGMWTYVYNSGSSTPDDPERDVFNVNLGGSSFKMIIKDIAYDADTNNIDVITYPKREIKVRIYHNGYLLGKNGAWEGLDETDPNDYIYFVVTDEKGNKFYFYPGDVQKDYNTLPDAINPYYRYRTVRWVVTKIETITGNVINYQYRKFDGISYPYYVHQKVKERWQHEEVISNVNTYFSDTLKIEADSIVNWAGSVSHVSHIEYPNGTNVIFNFEDDPTTNVAICLGRIL